MNQCDHDSCDAVAKFVDENGVYMCREHRHPCETDGCDEPGRYACDRCDRLMCRDHVESWGFGCSRVTAAPQGVHKGARFQSACHDVHFCDDCTNGEGGDDSV